MFKRIMGEHVDGPILHRAIVVKTAKECGNDELVLSFVYSKKRRMMTFCINHLNPQKEFLKSLRKGDEMYVASDGGGEYANVTRNPWWKRFWLRLTV